MKKLNKRRATKRILSRFTAHNRRLYPFFFHIGPVALCITSVLLIGLMAILYLNQVGQTVSANQQMEDIRSQQSVTQRQDQDLVDTIAQERSPSYVARNARKQGLVPVDPKDIQTVVVPHLQPIPTQQGPVETP